MMATRPVFIAFEKKPFYAVSNPAFDWNPGFSVTQKQKNVKALHEAFSRMPLGRDARVLEVSSKSTEPLGKQFSAFTLKKYVPALDKAVPLECLFQGGKVFTGGGPYTELYAMTPREAKHDERLKTSGRLVRFEFDGVAYPLEPKTVFFDWMYLCALKENPQLAQQLLQYNAFTDIEFNPEKSINCQARSCAIFVALHDRLDGINTFEDYQRLLV